MIKHYAFFDALGSMQEHTPEWNSVFAGLSVLRLADRLAELRESTAREHDLDASQRAVEAVSEGDPIRAILERALERIKAQPEIDPDIGANLLSYGRALDLQGEWSLAADVFRTIADTFPERTYPQLVIEASTALGAAARNTGDWRSSGRAYARAEHLADSIGDHAASLTARVGLANSEMFRGNLPAADAALEEIANEANRLKLQSVESIALHDRASVAHLKGDYQRTIHLAYRSLELTTNASARERLVADIAAAYGALGMKDVARNGYSIVAMTSPHQAVRWQATLNLMELAIDDGDEAAFDDFVARLESTLLNPRLRTYYLFFKAIGWRKFDRPDTEALFEQARSYAEENKLHQIEFEIESAASKASPPQLANPNPELAQIAEVLAHLREEAER